MSAKQRQLGPDLLKVAAIFGVVYIHSHWLFGTVWSQIFDSIFRAAVPCFIILWAYFFQKSLSGGKPVILYSFKRFLHLFTVFIVWSLIYLALKETWTMPTVLAWIIRHFSGGAWAGQYFFIIILQLIPLFILLLACYRRPKIRWVLVVGVVALYFALGYGLEFFPAWFRKLGVMPFYYHLAYVFAGIALARGHFPKFHPACALTPFLIPIEFALITRLGLEYSAYLTPAVLLSSICVTAVFLQYDFQFPKSERMRHSIRFVASHTLTVFVANPLIIGLVAAKIQSAEFSRFPEPLSLAASFIFAACVVAVGSGLGFLMNKLRLTGVLN